MTDREEVIAHEEPIFYHVTGVEDIEGPVGMDRGIWLNFDTVKGKITLKLSHMEAGELKHKLENEVSIDEWRLPPSPEA
jgi:hypothetical protein